MNYRMSILFGKTWREVSAGVETTSHRYLTQGGFIDMLSAGIYSYLPLGFRVYKKIEKIIREEMDAIGGQEMLMPAMHPASLWQETGRFKELSEDMFQFEDHSGKKLVLGMTHEEVITDLLRKNVNSYRDLPFMAYQIQTKFRDEKRPRAGLLRVREFMMKDAYSFHTDQKSLEEHYEKEAEAYKTIFARCGLKDVKMVKASSGPMGGKVAHEFILPSEVGEEEGGIELGHIFQLGTKYSEAMKADFVGKDGKKKPVIMGCYGIGLGRLMAAIVEAHNDGKGIIWPASVAPFDVHLVVLGAGKEIEKETEKAIKEINQLGFEVLVDDREETAGVKFADADLIGIPQRMIISEKTIKEKKYELKNRETGETKFITNLKEL